VSAEGGDARRSPAAGPSRRDSIRRGLVALFVLAGVIQLGIVGLARWRSHELEREARAAMHGNALSPGAIARARGAREDAAEHHRIGHLEIARLGLDVPVVEGVDGRSLVGGVGHVPNSAFPGEPDNLALAGHRDTHFASLRDVEPGDRIRIDTADGVFYYRIDTTFIVPPTRGDLVQATGRPTITLVTCYPFQWIGPAPRRFIVRGHIVAGDTAGTEPAGRS
jgi:sortase A